MPEACIERFKVAIEVVDFICYVKYVNKNENNIVDNITDDLFNLFNNKQNISKDEIKKIINLYRNQLTPSMLKEDKFSLPFNPINDEYIKDFNKISDTYNSQFIIKTNKNIENYFNKNEFMNQFSDLNQDSMFLLDIRYYGLKKKYYEVDFELHLTEKELYLTSDDEKLIQKFLEQYTLEDVCNVLGVKKNINYNHYLEQNDILKTNISEIYPFNKSTLLEQLVDFYEEGNCVFINNVFLNSIGVNFKDLIKSLKKPKLLVVLEKQSYSYFNQHNSKINRIDNIENNIVIYIDEYLFREAIGNMGYLILINDNYQITLNKLNKEYADIVYLAKGETKNLNIIKNILEKFFDIKNISSYIDNLLYLVFVLSEEEINNNLHYYLTNTLKTSNSLRRFNLETREQLPFQELKKLVNIYYLASDLNKKIMISADTIKLLLNDMLSMIKRIDNIKKFSEFNAVMKEVFKIFNIDNDSFSQEINKILTLLDIKKAMFEKEKSISFILDTSVLMDEPDIFHKYFNNNSIIIHSVVKDELENFRGSNINAIRAIRNINYLKNNSNSHIEYIDGEKTNTEFTKLYKLKVFENLVERLNDEGKYPIIVSNDDELILYENKKSNIIELNHIPLLFY